MISSPASTDSVAESSQARSRLRLSSELWAVLGLLTVLYILGVVASNRRLVWLDELFTFDIARARSLKQLWMPFHRFDFQPPTGYLLSRVSMKLFGENKFGLRFPSMLEFYIGSMALFSYVRRKVGISYAAAALLILWMGQTFFYAVEARPYALLMMCFSLLLLCWDIAVTSEKRDVALWGVAIANLGMFSAHVFAPFSLLPFLAAEAVRFRRTRKPDFALWTALVLPTSLFLFYVPTIHDYVSISFAPAIEASLTSIPVFFYKTINVVSLALLLAVSAALLVRQEEPRATSPYHWRREELVLFGWFLLVPILLNIAMMPRHGQFSDRYAITTEAAIYIGMAILVGIRLKSNRSAGYAAAAILMVIFCLQAVLWPIASQPPLKDASALASIRPDLPLVDANPATFFEMNHHEKPEILSRLFFLKDRSLALKYTHMNYFEDRLFVEELKPYFLISPNVVSYADFIHQHREFLVLGTFESAGTWLLPKLKDDGAQFTWLGTYRMPYRDSNLYLVNLSASK
jgi:4-amino-4-deoxy-L-arabinose transferase-like glycosyltransferase